MNKVIPSALFSAQDPREGRLRLAVKTGFPKSTWDHAAEGSRKNDPHGRRAAKLRREVRKH